ncbi:MAG: hypothetical protein ACRD2E_02010 [Terriglobales bacterium]
MDLPFGLGRRCPYADAPVIYPRQALAPDQRLRRPVPMTIAPPLSGAWVHTADNRPEDPRSWQNEPGPGVDEPPAAEIVHRSNASLERVPLNRLPAG